jgi:hypothetical protein
MQKMNSPRSYRAACGEGMYSESAKPLAGRLARMDNRDVGLSTHLHQYGEPSVFKMIFSPKTLAHYLLKDMAANAIAVLDALG